MIRRCICFFFFAIVVILVSGCASLKGDVPFRYQPSLIPVTQKVDKIAGINMLTDNRPKGDISYTVSIKDISEKVTSKLLEDFEKSKIFTEIHYPAQLDDDIVINGTIDRFIWKLYATPVAYIPLLPYFGVPCYEAYGIAGVTLKMQDNKTGTLFGEFSEESKVSLFPL